MIFDWTEFSSIPEEQDGYYAAFDAEVEGADHVIVTLKRNGVPGGKPARANASKENFVFFLGADSDIAEQVDGAQIVGYDASNNVIDSKDYRFTIAIE